MSFYVCRSIRSYRCSFKSSAKVQLFYEIVKGLTKNVNVRTETCPKICQLEFRATKIAMALLTAEPNWQCSQQLSNVES